MTLELLNERLDVCDEGDGPVVAVAGPGALAVAALLERQGAIARRNDRQTGSKYERYSLELSLASMLRRPFRCDDGAPPFHRVGRGTRGPSGAEPSRPSDDPRTGLRPS